MRKILSMFAAMLVAIAVNAAAVVLPATLDVSNVSFRPADMPDFTPPAESGYSGTYFDMGAHDNPSDTLLYAEWDVTIEPLKYNIAVDVYNTNSWTVQLYLLNQTGDTVKALRYKGSSGKSGNFSIGSMDMRDLAAGNYKLRARAARDWSAMKLKDVIVEADYHGANVALPSTLTPAYAELFNNASISGGAIAFKPSTANTDYATWNVSFAAAGEFNVTIDITASNGHNYGVALLSADGATEIGAVTEGKQYEDTGEKELGSITVPTAGNYKVKLTNAILWSEAVLNSITFAAPAPAGCDWDKIDYFNVGIADTDESYNQFKVCKEGTNPNIVNIQTAPWADNNKGIYINFPTAEIGTVSLEDGKYKIDGAGILLFLSAFTAVETEVTVQFQGADCKFTVYNAKGGATPDPVENLEINFMTDSYTLVAPASLPAGVEVAGTFHDNQHGYNYPKVSIPVAAGNYKITIGNCVHSNNNGASVKNPDESATLNLIDKNGQTITSFLAKDNCYDAKPTENFTSAWLVVDADQTIKIICPQYTPYLKFEKVDAVPEAKTMYTVTFVNEDADAEGIVPAAIEVEAGQSITLPLNYTLYKEGYTLTAWASGNNFAPGTLFEPKANTTLTAVFSKNEVDNILELTTELKVKWVFGESNGIPSVAWNGAEGFLVTQAAKIDIKLDIDAKTGKFSNSGRGDEWAQVNNGTKFSFPSKEGAIVKTRCYAEPTGSLVDNAAYTSWEENVATFNVDPTAGVSQLANNADNVYYSYLEITLPATVAKYDVTPNGSIENGSISVDKSKAAEGETITITINPAAEYELDWLKVNGSETGITIAADKLSATFTMPGEAVTVDAAFKKIAPATFAIEISAGIKNGTVVADKAEAAAGEEVTLTITPADNYELDELTVRGQASDELVKVENNKFNMPAEAVTVSATFKVKPVSLTDFLKNKPTTAVQLGELTVLYATGKNTYVIDENGVALVIYDANKTYYDGKLAAGKVLTGQMATYTLYSGQDEIIPTNTATVSDGAVVAPTLLAGLPTTANVNQYVRLENLSVAKISNKYYHSTTDNEKALQLYAPDSNLTKNLADGNYDVEGIIVNFNGSQLEILVFAIAKSTATGIDNTNAAVKAVKVIENGQIFIIKDGKTFNMLGELVK